MRIHALNFQQVDAHIQMTATQVADDSDLKKVTSIECAYLIKNKAKSYDPNETDYISANKTRRTITFLS
jgi:hypothetical protein